MPLPQNRNFHMENFSFAKKHRFSAGNIKIMAVWLPAWKTLVNFTSSSNKQHAKESLRAALLREVTSLHPCPWLSALFRAPARSTGHSAAPQLWPRGARLQQFPLWLLLAEPELWTRAKKLPAQGDSRFADRPAQQQKNHTIHSIPNPKFSFYSLPSLSHFCYFNFNPVLDKYFSDSPLPPL